MAEQSDRLIRKLIEKLADQDPVVRRNAAGALALNGARAVGAIPAIEPLLQDGDARVREVAERAIVRLKFAVVREPVARAG
jgi:HEAT repeat protein